MREQGFLSATRVSIFGILFHIVGKNARLRGYSRPLDREPEGDRSAFRRTADRDRVLGSGIMDTVQLASVLLCTSKFAEFPEPSIKALLNILTIALGPFISRRGAPGRMAIANRSTASCAMNC